MKLRNKILLGIGLVWLLFLTFTYAGSRYFLLKGFLQLEQERTYRDLDRVDQALDQINLSLYTFSSDWAHWNDLYDYMQGKRPLFIANNLNMNAFLNLNVNFLSYWNKNNELMVGAAIDTDQAKLTAFPTGLDQYIFKNSSILSLSSDLRGYVLLPDGIMMISAIPATDSNKTQPSIGTMVTGRFLSKKIITQIEEIAKIKIELLLPQQIEKNKIFSHDFSIISTNSTGHFSEPLNEQTLQGFTLIRDIYNKPIGMLRIVLPRSIYQTGMRSIHYYLISFVALGILFAIVMMWMLRILVIRRLEYLNRKVAEIGLNKELSQRVNVSGTDELSSVVKQINQMLDIIQVSQEKLEHHVAERTQELKSTNIKLEQEITERKSVENDLITHKEHLVRLAHYDPLTLLPNRIFFNEMLNKRIISASNQNQMLAVLFIDIDRFKKINDALGHHIGDLVLKELAVRFSSILDINDILARLGGDEFIILLHHIQHATDASSIAEKLLKACAHPVKIDSHEFYLTASIGICIYPNGGASLEDLQKNADMAMYKAKHAGGDVYEYYKKEMDSQAHAKIELEAGLRKALQNNEFVLHYQPKLNLQDGTITGAEALIRWEHPKLGIINPITFIPLAEETGLIMQIGKWTLYEAARANKSWQNQGFQPISVAVNISPKQFQHQDIKNLVSNVLAETGLEAKYLELEITETAIMNDVEKTASKLNDIHRMGIKISIDDFGTGYTSINYLKQFPISVLKVDQSFTRGIPKKQNDLAITSGVIALAHSLSIQVVAEGVETAEQLQFLADNNCDMVQGYYLSRPLPENKFILQLTKLS